MLEALVLIALTVALLSAGARGRTGSPADPFRHASGDLLPGSRIVRRRTPRHATGRYARSLRSAGRQPTRW